MCRHSTVRVLDHGMPAIAAADDLTAPLALIVLVFDRFRFTRNFLLRDGSKVGDCPVAMPRLDFSKTCERTRAVLLLLRPGRTFRLLLFFIPELRR
jgi:hypothetical protein